MCEPKDIQSVEGEIVFLPPSSLDFLKRIKTDPIKAVGEVALGVWGKGSFELAKSGARVFHAARFGQGFSQFVSELSRFQEEGKIDTDADIIQNKLYAKSLVDLMEVIDSNPDEDYLTAVKGLFFLLLSVDKEESDRIRIYQLITTIKGLSASELSTLCCIYQLYKEIPWQGIPSGADHWMLDVTKKSPHKIRSFTENDEEVLIKLRLITPRQHGDRSGIDKENWRLTDLGIALCQYIEEGKTTFYS